MSGLPKEWRQLWSSPPNELRPLQIVHGIPPAQATLHAMGTLKEIGFGGIVCNVDFNEYLVSDTHWETLRKAIQAARQVGLVIWIYDEQGYPSGAAGGLVMKENPAFDSQVLVYDPSQVQPFAIRSAYEHTHASNNYYAARRCPNLIDKAAMHCFIDKTHQAYCEKLGGDFGEVQAFFTDEPSLMAVNLGQLPEHIRKNVRVDDPVDQTVKPLPMVPWCNDLTQVYQRRYGVDLLAVRSSLFTGKTEKDRLVRRQYWALIADLIADRFFGQIQQWSHTHHVASSGHSLHEENLICHVGLYGNSLKALGRMDIPGLDVLTSEPSEVLRSMWLTASLPASAALFNGGRKVMTEVSDFSQRMATKQSATLEKMQATAAWQAAFGVTEFTSYYLSSAMDQIVYMIDIGSTIPFDMAKYQGYCEYVGKLNAILRQANPDPKVLLYYPIYDLWAEYLPVADKLDLSRQTQRAQQLVHTFFTLGQQMVRSQISFALTDHEILSTAKVRNGGLWFQGRRFEALLLPANVELPETAKVVVNQWEADGGYVFRAEQQNAVVDMQKLADIQKNGFLEPACDHVVAGRFIRDCREILLLVNVADKPYSGRIRLNQPDYWLQADPDNGTFKACKSINSNWIDVSLDANRAIFLISPAKSTVGEMISSSCCGSDFLSFPRHGA
ncbi:MAG: hypothetical protein JXD22_01435 [Sedimentisphaerales bacterium]|nr:hypothetical protein [Sedimentisphaerales bacterium]